MTEAQALVWLVGMMGLFVAVMLVCIVAITYYAIQAIKQAGFQVGEIAHYIREQAYAK